MVFWHQLQTSMLGTIHKKNLSPKKACELPLTLLQGNISGNPSDQFTAALDENIFRLRLLSIQSTAGWLTSFEKDSENENSLVNKITACVSFMYHDSKDLSSDDVVSMFQNYFQGWKFHNRNAISQRGLLGVKLEIANGIFKDLEELLVLILSMFMYAKSRKHLMV